MPDEDITYETASPVRADAITAGTIPIWQKLLEIQRDLKVEKGQWNSFGKYKFRSKEDILEAAKPLCHDRGLALMCDDEVIEVGGWKYIRSVASVTDVVTRETVSARGLAREDETKKGMDGSQITGTASSYAGKRALGNLFALDDTKDSDAPTQPAEKQPPAQGPFTARCKACGHVHQFQDLNNYNQWLAYWQQGGDQNRCCPTPTLEVM